jgi:hypothetical protein
MRNIARACVVCAVIAVVFAPTPVRADGYVNPWIGADGVNSNDNGSVAFGVTTGYMGAGVFGFEADFGYSPNFLGLVDQFDHTHGVTLFGDAIFGIPIGGTHGAGIRPFVTGGLGLLRTHSEIDGTDVSLTSNSFGYEAGVGMMGFFSEHIGLRGDLRYFRSLQDQNFGSGFDFSPGKLHFWRVSGGLTFR